MTAVDALGYLAASLVLATFCAKEMVPLRALAIASNIAFVAYAFFAGLGPILLLHSLMLPMNILRLREALEARNQPQLDVERGELDRANNNQNLTHSGLLPPISAPPSSPDGCGAKACLGGPDGSAQRWRNICLLQSDQPCGLAAARWLGCGGVTLTIASA
jgi:hypothetical protein